MLYSKDGKTLIERIAFQTDDEGSVIIPEGVTTLDLYALSNHRFVTSYTLPTTLEKSNSLVFSYTPALKELVFKSPTAKVVISPLNGNSGVIVIDTGNEATNLASLESYQQAWKTTLDTYKTWTIKTKGQVEATQNAVITNLSSDNVYSNNLW